MLLLAFAATPSRAANLVQSDTIQTRAERSVRLLEKVVADWKIPCASCHHHGIAMVALNSARVHGIPLNEEAQRGSAARGFSILSQFDPIVSMPIDVFMFGYGLAGAQAHVEPNATTSLLARKIIGFQLPEGNWPANDARPPHSESVFTGTAFLVRALEHYAPRELSTERDAAVARARQWFASAEPVSNEDRTSRLFGLLWSGASLKDRKQAVTDLLNRQREDGGWSQTTAMTSDAYATGQALVALRLAGALPTSHPAIQRAARYLLDTQEPDGSWHVHTRLHSKLQISPPFFETGFPHGRDQFISTLGTAWAAMGLLEMLPRVPNAPKALPVSEAKPRDLEPWLQTASFGTAGELKQLLEAGLSPNVKTKSGLTVLMAAAPDTTKLRMLLDNGADVNLKSGGGDTALSIAATYRNGYDAVRLLLEHGAAAGDVDKLITAASMGGDTKTMSLLLNRFKPQSIPGRALLEAVGWDNVGMVKVLAKAGADVNTRHEHQQMTALIQATLMHRTAMVNALMALGADPTLKDELGMTAAQHTGDIWFADPLTSASLP